MRKVDEVKKPRSSEREMARSNLLSGDRSEHLSLERFLMPKDLNLDVDKLYIKSSTEEASVGII